MIIPLSLEDKEIEQYKRFANMQNQTLSVMIRTVVNEKIQEEQDWKIYQEALLSHGIDKKTYSLKEIKKECGIQ